MRIMHILIKPPKDHPCQVWFNLVQRGRFKCESLRRTRDAKWWQKLTRKKDAINEFEIEYWTSNPVLVKFPEYGNRNFFNCPLLLYYKSKWAQIFTAATWKWVVKHIFQVFLWNFSFSRFIPIMRIYMLIYPLSSSCS
jgi:hypothetical protein